MNLKKIALFSLPLILISTSYFTYQQAYNASTKENLLTVGIATGYAPFISVNQSGQYEGFDIDVIKAAAQIMNKKLILKDLGSMTSLMMALDQNKVDAVIWGLSITQERLKKIAMINYQGEKTTAYPLIFWNKIPDRVLNINDMKNMIVCVEPTSSQDAVLQKYPFITIKPTEKIDDALLNIQYDKADAALVEPAIANKYKRMFPEIQTLDVKLALEDQIEGVGIGIKKENISLIEEFKKAIEQLKKNGTLKNYETKWDIA